MAGRRGAPPSFKEGKLQKRDFRSRTPEEMAEIQKKAAEARRKKCAARKAMREQLSMLLKMDVSDVEQKQMLKDMGLDDEEMCNQMVLMVALFKKGAKGDVAAIKQIDDMTNGIVPEQSQPIVINIKSAKGEASEVEAAGNGIRKSKARHDNEATKITGSKASVKIKQEAEVENDDEKWPDEDDEDWPDEE